MSKTFRLHIPDNEHQALKLAAVQSDASMNQFIRDAIAEKIARQPMEQSAPAPDALGATGAEHSASGALAEASAQAAEPRALKRGGLRRVPEGQSWPAYTRSASRASPG